MAGLHFEDWEVDEELETPGRTISEADVMLFAGLTGDYNRVHTDEAFASKSLFGKRIAHGLLGLAIGFGLFMRMGYITDMLKGAYLGLHQDFTAPIFLGDSITGKVRVASKKETKRGDAGIITFVLSLFNQKGEEVQRGEHTLLFSKREIT